MKGTVLYSEPLINPNVSLSLSFSLSLCPSPSLSLSVSLLWGMEISPVLRAGAREPRLTRAELSCHQDERHTPPQSASVLLLPVFLLNGVCTWRPHCRGAAKSLTLIWVMLRCHYSNALTGWRNVLRIIHLLYYNFLAPTHLSLPRREEMFGFSLLHSWTVWAVAYTIILFESMSTLKH